MIKRLAPGQLWTERVEELEAENGRLLYALKIAAQWVPLPHQAYTPDARRDAEIVQAALSPSQHGGRGGA